MYAGHLGVALGAYSLRRTIPLWILLIATQLPDWLDAGLCATGIGRGRAGLYSHGFAVLGISAIALGGLYLIFRRDFKGALIVALAVLSHYALDYITGQKPTWSGGPIVGLSLYSKPLLNAIVESATILAGWLLYRATLPEKLRNSVSSYGILLALIAFQIAAGIAFYLKLGGDVKC